MLVSRVIDSSRMVHNLTPFVCFDTKRSERMMRKKREVQLDGDAPLHGMEGGNY